MNILVTGAAGFLGSHVVDALLTAGHNVTGVDDLSTGKREWCATLCLTMVFSAVPLDTVESVVHCAAVADISQNWAKQHNRDEIYATNIDSLIVLLERLPATVKHFVFVSSAAVEATQVSPYTASKIAGEALCLAYCQQKGIGLSVIRPVSMLGPRYHHGHIADFVRMLNSLGAIVPQGSLTAIRPYAHVRDVAATIAHSAEVRAEGNYTITVHGRAWSAAGTVALLGGPSLDGVARPADPDVDAFVEGDATEWVQETIDWCQEHIT